jgi:tight adherence protein C
VSGAAAVAGAAGAFAAGAVVELAALAGRRRRGPAGARLLALIAGVGHRLGAPAAPIDLDGRLAAAGRPLGLRVADVTAIKAGAAALGVALALPLGALLPGRLPLLVPVVLPAAAFLAPDWWLRRRARARGRTMQAELPDLLDLLRVALGAGLALDRALAEVARRDRGALAHEWRTAAVEIALGVPRGQALAALLARCPCPGMAPLIAALERAGRHGAPLADALAAQAREARAAQARRLGERAARAAPKIQLVVALLLVPSVLLLVAAALLATLRP